MESESSTGHVIKNVNHVFHSQLTRGQRVADMVARIVGSWPFIIVQSIIILIWLGINGFLFYMKVTNPGFFDAWDPYPFILLNLVLSFQAAYTGPVVMMSQNRQSEKDRLMAEHDYHINLKAEKEVKEIMKHLIAQDEMMAKIMTKLEALSGTKLQSHEAAKHE